MNLTVNALEAGAASNGQVRIGGQRFGNWVELFVEDSGKGMTPECSNAFSSRSSPPSAEQASRERASACRSHMRLSKAMAAASKPKAAVPAKAADSPCGCPREPRCRRHEIA